MRLDEVGQYIRRGQQAMARHRRYDQGHAPVLHVRRVHDGNRISNSDHDLKGGMTVQSPG
jgi:hypothetical protein